jgi:LysR family glycine cleavage system transcriptional activator
MRSSSVSWSSSRKGIEKFPDVTIDIVSRLEPVNFEEEQFDAALQRREMRSATVQWDDLMEERLVVVGSPTLVSSPVPDDELVQLPLLQQTTRPTPVAGLVSG